MGTGIGRLADVQRLENEVRQAQQAVDAATGTAEAGEQLIEATVTGNGELRELVLDPRVYREFAPEVLAAEIVTAVNEARAAAHQNALDAWIEILPADAGDDVTFEPMLAELRRMRETVADGGLR
ncbi:DNA-binding protein YbaB [Kribbella pratensis]|uniref:DNA-binding protein YbaB n=1 Tax=Kribbella pratensis TaxID=2512112 RepID=A0ABY2FGF5_9ACTN|nr:YbaB/EbfC family nucleoid-associated protein [Kribbella pratensis]TDW90436.1 DNA-binding protein YbaB [Kribbella pratensis]